MTVAAPERDTAGRLESRTAPRPRLTSSLWPLNRAALLVIVAVIWVVLAIAFQGQATLVIGGSDQVGVQSWFGRVADSIVLAGNNNPVIVVTQGISSGLHALIQWLQLLLSAADFPSPYPYIGFLGVVAIAWFVTALVAGWRMSVLTVACFIAFAVLGFYEDSMDLLIVTGVSVALCLIIGMPLAVLMAHNRWARAVLTPILDVMQTLPSFAYLLPLMLLFGIGAPAAVMCTLIYALPPVMRIAAHGIENVSETTIEAAESMGQTFWQRLLKVELPMAKHTIVVGINQTTMAALSMATIAAFINGPGLGQPVIIALTALRVGDAFVPGLCIVLMAIMLDRVTTAASEHSEKLSRGQNAGMAARRSRLLIGGAVATAVLVYLSRHYTWAAAPWNTVFGDKVSKGVQHAADWIATNISTGTTALTNGFTNWILNPIQNVVAGSPWFITALALLAIGVIVGTWRAGIAVAICVAGLLGLRLWNDSMVTLTATVVATIFVMVLAVVFGVWMGRSKRADQIIRPVLDAGQTLPAFVYLIPVLALFGATRFTAIVAAVLYAAPAAIKLVADGIRSVSSSTVEAARSVGAVRIQIITKVQIPMARAAFTVAANQGLLFVLAMVVIGGLVGAGALGYDVVSGFAQQAVRGRGLAAGFSIVLLGVMLDRITTYAARRTAARS
jgi:glycine betaine/proline transport system permease protein